MKDTVTPHAPKIKYRRRTIELHPDMGRMLDFLQDDLRLRSQTEVMQKAIQLLAFIRGFESEKAKKIYLEDGSENPKELIIF